MSDFRTLGEVVKAARQNLSQGVWDYLSGGAESETTLGRNRMALDSIAFRPRVLCNVAEIDTSRTVLGQKLRIPVLLAPMGSLDVLDPGGPVTVAKASEEFGSINFLSSVARPGIAEVRAAASSPMVYQLYVRGDEQSVYDIVQKAIDLGYTAFCFTVDTARYGRRERDLIKRYMPAGRQRSAGAGEDRSFTAALNWDLIKRVRDRFDCPLILKGIATAEDAALAVETGINVVYVSNHGGRQLDHGRGTIDVLPEVAEAVAGKAEIIIDGGFVRGTDVVKAIALGATAVSMGKMQGWGLAADGQAGIVRVLEILEEEIINTMGNLGVANLDQLDPTYLHAAQPVNPPGPFGAFPLIDLPKWSY